ncbi:hypothetical protein [Gemmatimonas sp.]|uniref:hypothetical protein n=2 Tax=Gemmatimonas sp. TaxID=1962908 RepID=UPI0035679C6D
MEAFCAGRFTLYALSERVRKGGIDGAVALLQETRVAVKKSASAIDLIPLVLQWKDSPLKRQDGKGMITVDTRLQSVARVLKLVCPDLAKWNTDCALASRPTKRNAPPKVRPPMPALRPFPLADFTAERIQLHLRAHYRMEPTDEQRDALESSRPDVPQMTRGLLEGQGDGARAAFDAFRILARWLIANGHVDEDPTARLDKPSASAMKLIKLDSAPDVDRLAGRMHSPLDDIWQTICGTGLEPSVTLDLDVNELDPATKEVIGLGTKNLLRQRRVECSEAAWNALATHRTAAVSAGRAKVWPSVDVLGR